MLSCQSDTDVLNEANDFLNNWSGCSYGYSSQASHCSLHTIGMQQYVWLQPLNKVITFCDNQLLVIQYKHGCTAIPYFTLHGRDYYSHTP